MKIFLLVVCVALSLNANSQILRAYYPFNGNADDASGNNIHGTVNGATLTTDRFNNANSAYQFDGVDDYIYLGQDVFNDNEGTFTFWFNATDFADQRPIFTMWDTTANDNGIKIFLKTNPTPVFQYSSDQRFCEGASATGRRQTINPASVGTWTFGAIVVEQDSTRLYLNCTEAQSIASSSPQDINGNWFADICSGDHAAAIGRHKRPASSFFFYGKLDDLRFFNYPLDSTQLDSLCTEGVVGITEQTQTNTFTIYPNPTEGKFEVRSLELGVEKVEVYDLFGRLVLSSTTPQIDMRGFAKGVYVVKAGEAVRKLVIE